ncbi:hypothetical protein QCA50_008140 [Cerrena zonata]|uniref:Uncharacterized protein n=1 Tax=Cerrena zonata TaxID=2478898 RepID=A0AAW0GF61_9APHY
MLRVLAKHHEMFNRRPLRDCKIRDGESRVESSTALSALDPPSWLTFRLLCASVSIDRLTGGRLNHLISPNTKRLLHKQQQPRTIMAHCPPPQNRSDNRNSYDRVANHAIPPSLARAIPFSQLSTLNVSRGRHCIKYPMDLHFLVGFLALMRNLEHLSLRNMISSSPIHCRTCQLAYLPRLRSLRLYDTVRRLVSLLDHISIPPDTVLDLEIADRGNMDSLFDIFLLVGDVLNGNNTDTPQTFDALSIHLTSKGLVVKGFIDEPELSKLCGLDSLASVRICLPIWDPSSIHEAVQWIASNLPISSVKMLSIGDTAVGSMPYPVLTSFLKCMPALKVLHWVETKLNMPSEHCIWNATIFFDSSELCKLDIILYLVQRHIDRNICCRNLRSLLVACTDCGLDVWKLHLKRVGLQRG